MSLDNIQLPAIVIANLYKDSLIDLDVAQPIAQKTSISFLGDNNKGVAIIVNDTNSVYLKEDELNFLMGILTACKLSMADVALVNLSTQKNITYQLLKEDLRADKIIFFGTLPADIQLPLEFPVYQIQNYFNSTYLAAPTLAVLASDKVEKTKLWNTLKQLFNLG
jgi:hypothetical protein